MTQDEDAGLGALGKELKAGLEEAGYFCFRYSGRAMYGLDCLAVRLDRKKNHTEWRLAQDVAKINVGTEAPIFDDLGLDKVAYWPSHRWD